MKGDAVPRKPEPVQDDPIVVADSFTAVHYSQLEGFVQEDGPSIDLTHLSAQPEAAATHEGAHNGE